MGAAGTAMQAKQWQLARCFVVANDPIPNLVVSERDEAFLCWHALIHDGQFDYLLARGTAAFAQSNFRIITRALSTQSSDERTAGEYSRPKGLGHSPCRQ